MNLLKKCLLEYNNKYTNVITKKEIDDDFKLRFSLLDMQKFAEIYHNKQLSMRVVVNSKRFTETDLLRAYKAGCIENHEGVPITSMEDFGEISKVALDWLKRYTE